MVAFYGIICYWVVYFFRNKTFTDLLKSWGIFSSMPPTIPFFKVYRLWMSGNNWYIYTHFVVPSVLVVGLHSFILEEHKETYALFYHEFTGRQLEQHSGVYYTCTIYMCPMGDALGCPGTSTLLCIINPQCIWQWGSSGDVVCLFVTLTLAIWAITRPTKVPVALELKR